MTLSELIATLGPVAGVAMFMWLNRAPQKAGNPDPIIQKLDALIDAHKAQGEASKAQGEASKAQATAMADLAKNIAILLDRSDR